MNPLLDISMAQMRAAAEQACGLMKVLSNPDRLLLLCQMAEGELCVSELEERLGIQQPTLSQQLGVLRQQELVTTRREGKNIYYKVADPRVLSVMKALQAEFCR